MKSKSNTTHGAAMAATPRIVLAFSAALVALAVACICAVAPALAASGSGGVTIGGDTSSDIPDVPPADASKYVRLWDKVAPHDKHWAKKTAQCESGGNPQAIGGGGKYRGAFQFMKSTWENAPKSPGGDPIDYPYKTQAVVAVALMRKDGAGHWPNCG